MCIGDICVENYRKEGRKVLLASGKITEEQVKILEQQAWDHSDVKYPIVIRRLFTGMSIFEAIAELEPITKMQEEEVMVDGTITCPKCKGRKIHRIEKQTRSADESATVFCYCSDCGKRWKF
jgi:DNA-directed RNA polymerase subunit M/transcription elongation factor TFIIS